MKRFYGLAGLALSAFLLVPGSAAAGTGTPVAPATPIRHLVVLMQTGHSFDNYFGTFPGARGIPADACLPTRIEKRGGNCVRPFHLNTRQPLQDLDHSRSTWSRQYDNGLMDGAVAAYRAIGLGTNVAMGYYNGHDLPFYWGVARRYVLFDHFFSSAPVGSRLNRFWWVSGRATPGGRETLPTGGYRNIPTIFDRLEAAGVSWKFYVQDYHPDVNYRSHRHGKYSGQTARVPLVDIPRFVNEPRLASHIADLSQYYADLNAGKLPAVAFIASSQASEDPPGNPQAGQRLVRQLSSALVMSPSWSSSAFMWTYDGWGGWYDQVRPPAGYGFRVPALLMSPYARVGQVNHTVLDYTGILRFVEYNWHLRPLASRDANSRGIISAFNFASGPRTAELVGTVPAIRESSTAVTLVVSAAYLVAAGLAVLLVCYAWLTRISSEEVKEL